jgi:hypothetical protein
MYRRALAYALRMPTHEAPPFSRGAAERNVEISAFASAQLK